MWKNGLFGWEEFWCLDVGPAELEDLRMLVVRGLCDLTRRGGCMSFIRRVRSMAVLIGEASEVARGREGQKWVGRMVCGHRVSMAPRTEVSVCVRETIRERK